MREEIEARPAAIFLSGLIFGLVAVPFPLSCLFVLLLALWVRNLPRKWILAFGFVTGLLLSPTPPKLLTSNEPIHAFGVITSVPMIGRDVQTGELRTNDLTLLASMPRDARVMLGDRIQISGIAKPLQSAYQKTSGFERVGGRIQLEDAPIVSQGSWLTHLADIWRRSFLDFLDASMPEKEANLVDAICFNGRRLLDSESRQQLVDSGLIHLVSASGLQVFVFGLLVTMLLRLFPIHRSVQVLVLAAVLVVYALGAGLQPQIVRAAAMTILGSTAYLVRRDPDPLSALAVSSIGYLLWRPDAVYGMSFQLSMIAVAAVILFYQPERRGAEGSSGQLVRNGKEFLRLSAVVFLATSPLIAYYLGVVSPVALLSNILVCWSVPFAVAMSFSAYLVWLLLPAIGESMAGTVLSPVAEWIYNVSSSVGGQSWALAIPDFNGLWLVAFYGGWLLTYRRRIVQP